MLQYTITSPETVKKCTKCGFECAVDDVAQFFYRHYAREGKFYSQCKECMRANYREKRSKDPDTFRNYGRKSYYKNRETRLASIRAKRAADPERWRRNARAYRERHPDGDLINRAKRRAKKLELGVNWCSWDRRQVLLHFHYTCAYCGSQFKDLFGETTIHYDHYIPVAKGGGTTYDNMMPTCSGLPHTLRRSRSVESRQQQKRPAMGRFCYRVARVH